MKGRRYALITPCRDEMEFARRTLDSVTSQSVLPTLWVIVDDGSTDGTPAILAEYAARHDWIRIIRREDRGRRSVGPGVVDAFYAGYQTIQPEQFDYICKLDLDLDLPPRYFEVLMQRMEADPRIGTCSGKPYFPAPSNVAKTFDGKVISEACGDEMSVGMTKFYRTDCFREVGGFVREVMWDGIDCHRCRMLGWVACSWDDPELRFLHLRPMGSSYKSVWTGRMRHGFGQYFMGTGPMYIVASAVFRLRHPPAVLGSFATLCGYFSAMLRRVPRYADADFRRFLRSYQRQCLLFGKRTATQRLDARATEVQRKCCTSQAEPQR